MDDKAHHKRSRVLAVVLSLVLLLPTLYVLSMGPVCVLALRGYVPMNAVNVVYEPIRWTNERFPVTRRPTNGYVRAWLRLTNTKLPWADEPD